MKYGPRIMAAGFVALAIVILIAQLQTHGLIDALVAALIMSAACILAIAFVSEITGHDR